MLCISTKDPPRFSHKMGYCALVNRSILNPHYICMNEKGVSTKGRSRERNNETSSQTNAKLNVYHDMYASDNTSNNEYLLLW